VVEFGVESCRIGSRLFEQHSDQRWDICKSARQSIKEVRLSAEESATDNATGR
jgi:hypothetical protein